MASKQLIAIHETNSEADCFNNYSSFYTEQAFEEFIKELVAIA